MKQLSSSTRSQLANALREYTTNVHTQHNLLSTATDAERRAFIERATDWWNTMLAPIYDEVVPPTLATIAPIASQAICRLDVELEDNQWHTLQSFDNLHQAHQLAQTLTNAGIVVMVSCNCGAYEYGACEQCANTHESEGQTPLKELAN